MPRRAIHTVLAVATSAALTVPAATADAAPPAAAAAVANGIPARLDLRVLVVDDGDSGVAAVRSRLDEEGVPYERIDLGDAARPVLTADFLAGTDAGGTFGTYSGVVLPNEAPAGLSADEQAALAAYERGYHVGRSSPIPGPIRHSASTGRSGRGSWAEWRRA